MMTSNQMLFSMAFKFLLLLYYFDKPPLIFAEPTTEKLLELIQSRGYPVETYQVTTEDGYILGVQRIPHGRNSTTPSTKPVLLQHASLMSATEFVLPNATQGLGYVLADAGYDVWLGNARGTFPSRNNTHLTPNQNKFWDFSWDEVAKYDLPATIDLVLNVTGQSQLLYLGYSEGTTTFYAMASSLPDYQKKIKAQFSLGPVAYLRHLTSPFFRTGLVASPLWGPVLKNLYHGEFIPYNSLLWRSYRAVCSVDMWWCEEQYLIVFQHTRDENDISLLKPWLKFYPAGYATRQVIHYGQVFYSDSFRKYDYGTRKNEKFYGSKTPPVYNLSEIEVPVHLFYSSGDEVANVKDVLRLCDELGTSCAEKVEIEDNKFRHADYIMGLKVWELLYPKLLSSMGQY